MAASLVLQGFGELVKSSGGTVTLTKDTSFGEPAVETAAVARLLFDGDVVSGRRSGNRALTLPVTIPATDPIVRAAIMEQLHQAVDAVSFTLTYTPSGGLPVVFDCFRGSMTRVLSTTDDAQGRTLVTLTIPALPFTRTPTPVSVTPTGVTTTQLEAFDATTGMSTSAVIGTVGSLSTSTSRVEGSASVAVPFTTAASGGGGQIVTGTLTKSFGSSQNLSTTSRVGLTVLNQPGGADLNAKATSVFSLTLTSSGGSSTWPVNFVPSKTSWQFVPFDITSTPASTTGSGVSLAAVTAWSITYSVSTGGTYVGSPFSPFSFTLLYDDLRAYPSGSGTFSGLAGNLRFDGVQGSARTPTSLAVNLASGVAGGLLISRASNTPPGFTPILPAPTGFATTSTDTTAISGHKYQNNGNGGAATAMTWTVPAYAYRKVAPDTSTYSLLVRAQLSGTLPVTVTVTAQLTGDPTTYQQTISRVYSTGDPDLGPQSGAPGPGWFMLSLGELTLPPRDIDPSNTSATIAIGIYASNAGNTAVLNIDQGFLLDMSGETVLTQLPTTINATGFYLDAPSASQFTGSIYYTPSGAARSNAVSAAPSSAGQFVISIMPGSNNLLVAVIPQQGQTAPPTPTVAASYYPRFWAERAS